MTTITTPQVPVPPGATEVGPWQFEADIARDFRHFTGSTRASASQPHGRPVLVKVYGDQFRDCTIEAYIMIDGDICLDAVAGRRMLDDLRAAVDEVEELSK